MRLSIKRTAEYLFYHLTLPVGKASPCQSHRSRFPVRRALLSRAGREAGIWVWKTIRPPGSTWLVPSEVHNSTPIAPFAGRTGWNSFSSSEFTHMVLPVQELFYFLLRRFLILFNQTWNRLTKDLVFTGKAETGRRTPGIPETIQGYQKRTCSCLRN